MSHEPAAGAKSASRDGLFLNVASSTLMLDGFVNLDNHVFLALLAWPRVWRRILSPGHRAMVNAFETAMKSKQFVRHDCRRPLPFGPETVDHILCSHFLEHVFPNEATAILAGFHRVLKPGGTLHIVLPDLRQMATDYVSSTGPSHVSAADEFIEATLLSRPDPGSLRFRLMEFTGRYGLAHRWMYDRYSISSKLVEQGFRLLDTNNTPSAFFRKDDGSLHAVAVRP
jgi:SAM-dependent methyltransferase